jgi:thiol-disulfide isomerase/thioredoxin
MTNSHPNQTSNGPSSSSESNNPKFRLPIWAKLLLLAAVIGLSSIGYLSSSLWQRGAEPTGQAETDPAELARRTPIQDFDLTDAQGAIKKFSAYKGNVVILSFWASWCTPCLLELPTFAELDQRFGKRGLKIVTVNVDEGDEGKTFARDFWNKKSFPFPSYFDTTKALSQRFEVDMLPSNFVIDRQGRLVFSSYGANDWTSAQTLEFIDGLLKETDKDPQTAEESAAAEKG